MVNISPLMRKQDRSDQVAVSDKKAAASLLMRVQAAARRASQALLQRQQSDGHWCFELEADCTIPAEYIMLMHFMDEIDDALQPRLANYIRSKQLEDGSWPLYTGGAMDLSCTVKSYLALKLAGDDIDDEHMQAARAAILNAGGAACTNVFTRIALALFEQVPWRAVPYIPPEIMHLPSWFPFNLNRIAYWSRTVMVPLLIIYAHKPKAANPRGIDIAELFTVPPHEEQNYFLRPSALHTLFLAIERSALNLIEPVMPSIMRRTALRKAERWFVERLNDEDGLGAIFPAMANAYMALQCLNYAPDDTRVVKCRESLRKLVIEIDNELAYCQPCVSPVWDTGWAAVALLSPGSNPTEPDAEQYRQSVQQAIDWLLQRQITDVNGDWSLQAPGAGCGGWAFQYANPHYPDLDDTGMVAALLQIAGGGDKYQTEINRALDWLVALQSDDGGFAAFDANNTAYYLNCIPFADHGALLDPPTEDVTGRVLMTLALQNRVQDQQAINDCIDYLRRTQQPDGSWWGRWGTNYIYGTWSVLAGLIFAGEDPQQDFIQRAIAYLLRQQQADGGWGESNDSYVPEFRHGSCPSTSWHTSWALLALMIAGEVHRDEVAAGIDWLLQQQQEDGLWHDPWHNAPGFPRVFYLKYHGYSAYFPTWTLNRYQQLQQRSLRAVA